MVSAAVSTTTADDPDGMRSITLVKVRPRPPARRPGEGLPAFSLLEVLIKTGRTTRFACIPSPAENTCDCGGFESYGDFDLNRRAPSRPQT